jgi:hypothetical protein
MRVTRAGILGVLGLLFLRLISMGAACYVRFIMDGEPSFGVVQGELVI